MGKGLQYNNQLRYSFFLNEKGLLVSTKHENFYECQRRPTGLFQTASGIRFMQKETSHHSLLCQQELSHSPDRKISIQADNLNLVLLQPANIFERVPDVASQP